MSTGPGPPSNSQWEASGAGVAETVLRRLSLCQAASNIPQVLLLKVQRDPRRTVWQVGLHPTPPRPGYLSGFSTAEAWPSHGMGAAVSVAALAGSLFGGGVGQRGAR